MTRMEPKRRARVAGAFYVATIVTGALAMGLGWHPAAVYLVSLACYAAVTVLFYEIFRPVSRPLSLLAAAFSLAGCALSLANAPVTEGSTALHPFVLFGCYCLLIGWLIARSTFLPKVLGVYMAIGGLGWLTFASPALAASLAPYNLVPGTLGEVLLTLWLLVMGVDARRWAEQAGARAMVPRPA